MKRLRRARSMVSPPFVLLGLTVALTSVSGVNPSSSSPWKGRISFTRRGSSSKRASSSSHVHHASQFGGPANKSTTSTPFLAGSNYRIDHRHGSSYGNSDASTISASVDDTIDSLVKLLSKDAAAANDDDRQKQEEEEVRLWKRLGKLRLDAGEFAEAARIFRYGSRRCPSDEGLRHHCQVHDAFHCEDVEDGSTTTSSGADGDKDDDEATHSKVPDPMQIPNADGEGDDLFLILDVPPDKVPANILQFSGTTVATPSLTRIICASKKPILSKEACLFLIQSATDAATKRGGWTTDRHVHAPTCDIPAFDLQPAAVRWIRSGFDQVLLPLIVSTLPSELGLSANSLRIQDCFIVRYDGEEEHQQHSDGGPGFSSLRPHEDESLVSLTIALNDMSEYEGGGLFVASTGDLLNGDAGTVLSFAGGMVHGGYPVSKGTRWILTVFLYIDKNLSCKEPGYTIRAIKDAVMKQK